MRKKLTIAGIVAAVIVALAVAGLPVYVYPQVDGPRHADAIVVLGGAGGETRYRYGLELAQQGYASTVLMSNPEHFLDDTGLCAARLPGVRVECFAPDPSTTRGEAQHLRTVAQQRGWRSVVVVTFRPHISRARYIVERCFTGRISMAESPQSISWYYWPFAYVYQTAGYVRAWLQSGC
ncbi:YdcF family protein [Williamsia sp. SKLECPSW1]